MELLLSPPFTITGSLSMSETTALVAETTRSGEADGEGRGIGVLAGVGRLDGTRGVMMITEEETDVGREA